MTREQMEKKIDEFVHGRAVQQVGWISLKRFIWKLILGGREEGVCKKCGEHFPMSRKDQVFCQTDCKKSYHNELRKVRDQGTDYEE
jgi:predicted amidophosphoribosyltransferase